MNKKILMFLVIACMAAAIAGIVYAAQVTTVPMTGYPSTSWCGYDNRATVAPIVTLANSLIPDTPNALLDPTELLFCDGNEYADDCVQNSPCVVNNVLAGNDIACINQGQFGQNAVTSDWQNKYTLAGSCDVITNTEMIIQQEVLYDPSEKYWAASLYSNTVIGGRSTIVFTRTDEFGITQCMHAYESFKPSVIFDSIKWGQPGQILIGAHDTASGGLAVLITLDLDSNNCMVAGNTATELGVTFMTPTVNAGNGFFLKDAMPIFNTNFVAYTATADDTPFSQQWVFGTMAVPFTISPFLSIAGTIAPGQPGTYSSSANNIIQNSAGNNVIFTGNEDQDPAGIIPTKIVNILFPDGNSEFGSGDVGIAVAHRHPSFTDIEAEGVEASPGSIFVVYREVGNVAAAKFDRTNLINQFATLVPYGKNAFDPPMMTGYTPENDRFTIAISSAGNTNVVTLKGNDLTGDIAINLPSATIYDLDTGSPLVIGYNDNSALDSLTTIATPTGSLFSTSYSSQFISGSDLTTIQTWNGGHSGDNVVLGQLGNDGGQQIILNQQQANETKTAINPNGSVSFTTDKQIEIRTFAPDIEILNFKLKFQCLNGTFDTTTGLCDSCCEYDLDNGTCQAEIEKIWAMFPTVNVSMTLSTSSPINITALSLVCREFTSSLWPAGCSALSPHGFGANNWMTWTGSSISTVIPTNAGVVINLTGNNVYPNITIPLGTASINNTVQQIGCEVNGTWAIGDIQNFTINKTMTITAN